METEVNVLIADDHPIVRQGLRQTIAAEPRFKIVADTGSGRTALELIRKLRPQIVVLDIDMPDLDGFAVAREIREERLPVDIIFLTFYRDEEFFNEALRLGTKGYVLKDAAVTDIVSGLRAVAAGQHYTSPALTSYLVERRQTPVPDRQKPGVGDLTATERRILALIAEYKTSREIGDALHISPRTVDTHRAHICTKLELHGSHALMKFALDHKSQL
jgi:DNA-binding NarL/FixJ family response regulator